MTSSPDTASPVDGVGTDTRTGKFPGWWVVTGCFLVLMVNSGLAFYGLAVYLNAFSNEKGWALGTISFGTTIFFIVGGAAGMWAAKLIARYDVRYVLVGGAIIAGASLALLGQVQTQWQMFLVYGVFALGYAGAGLVPATTDVTRWGPARGIDREQQPPLIGNRRQGPDLTNVGLRRTRDWQRAHLIDPRSVSPGSRMPSYAHLFDTGDARGTALVEYLGGLGRPESPATRIACSAAAD